MNDRLEIMTRLALADVEVNNGYSTIDGVPPVCLGFKPLCLYDGVPHLSYQKYALIADQLIHAEKVTRPEPYQKPVPDIEGTPL